MVAKTVLIDDSDIDLFIQKRFLEVFRFTHEIVSYRSAREALGWLSQLDHKNAPDVIFLDLNMPEMDGFGFLKEFALLPSPVRNKTHIVVLTSSSSAKDRQTAMSDPNVIHFFSKPLKQYDIETLKTSLKTPSGQART